MRKLTIFCIVVFAAAITLPAFAATQNVKVSGDITVRGIHHGNYDLDDNNAQIQNSTAVAADENEQWATQNIGLNVEADLTDNVSTYIRLISQRDWDDPALNAGDTTAFDVIVDESYITLKEMLYAPLTLKIGRQNLWFGKGFIVGAKLRDPESNLIAEEYTEVTSFDAIRATLDYDPWTIDLVYSKIEDRLTQAATGQGDPGEDDIQLAGINVGYKFSQYNGEAEGYYWLRQDKTGIHTVPLSKTWIESDEIHVIGGRGSLEPIANLTVFGELAYQWGSYGSAASVKRDRHAWGADIGGDYTFANMTWQPRLGAEYIFYQGQDATALTGDYEAWNSLYRGKFDTAIREFQNLFYQTEYDNVSGTPGGNNSTTNQHQVQIRGGLKPWKDLDIAASFTHFWHDAQVIAGRSDEIGDEVDVKATYDYTEDVEFSLLGAWFLPGKYYISGQDDTASDVVGSVKVVF